MTIFLTGSDGYRRTKRLRILLGQFLSKYPGVGIRRVDAAFDPDAASVIQDIFGSASLFSPRTLVVLDSALELQPSLLKTLVERTASSDAQHLILVADTDKPTKAFARLTEEDVKQEMFPTLSGSDWAMFVSREAAARRIPLAKQQLQQLAYAFPGDSWGIATELDVLAAMPEPLRAGRIAETLRKAPLGAPSWSDLRRIGSGAPAARLVALARIEAAGEAAAKTFAMAAYSADARAAAEGDLAIKTGGWDHEEALLNLALA